MTADEMRSLDAFCALKVMGWQLDDDWYCDGQVSLMTIHDWNPTRYWQDAGKVLEKCAEKQGARSANCGVLIYKLNNCYLVSGHRAQTLPLAICKFAKALYSK